MMERTGQGFGGLVLMGALLAAPMHAHADLQQTLAPVVGGGTAQGVLDTDTGLQWLTPQATMGLSYAQVSGSSLTGLGYRYATAQDLVGLLGHAGFNTTPLTMTEGQQQSSGDPSDLQALRALVGLLGNTTGHADPIPSNAYSNILIYGILADTSPADGYLYAGAHYMATLDATTPSALVNIPGARFPTSDANVGSFLVREVPEPGTLGMLLAGLLTLCGARRFRR